MTASSCTRPMRSSATSMRPSKAPIRTADAAGRARMAQAINIVGVILLSPMIGIFVQRAVMPMTGGAADEDAIGGECRRPRPASRRWRS